MSAPQWPGGLEDTTPLPYHVWRVLTHVDGKRDITEVARLANMTVPDVQDRLNAASSWISRSAQRHQTVSEETVNSVIQCLTSVLGPMAAVMVDDALDELGDGATLHALLTTLAKQLSQERVQVFARHLRERGVT